MAQGVYNTAEEVLIVLLPFFFLFVAVKGDDGEDGAISDVRYGLEGAIKGV